VTRLAPQNSATQAATAAGPPKPGGQNGSNAATEQALQETPEDEGGKTVGGGGQQRGPDHGEQSRDDHFLLPVIFVSSTFAGIHSGRDCLG